MKTNNDLLPGCSLYAKYLQVASFKFHLSIAECRKKFGLFTISEWNKLLSN